MTKIAYVIGIDGGGTGCRVSVCDPDGQERANAIGGPANFSTDPEGAVQNVLDAIAQVKVQFPKGALDLAHCAAHIGLAGIMQKSDADAVAAAAPSFARLTISDDRNTSLAGALGDADGVLISVGTGSFVAAQKGNLPRFLGGWGHVLGDQASGAWLGTQGVRRAVLAYEGLVPQSDLTQQLMQECGGTPLNALAFANDAGPAEFAAIAPHVIRAAQKGDAQGQALMEEGAQYLMACLHQMNIVDHDRLCLTGGIGPHYADYLPPEFRSLIKPPQGTALDGAVHLARQLL